MQSLGDTVVPDTQADDPLQPQSLDEIWMNRAFWTLSFTLEKKAQQDLVHIKDSI